MPEQIGLNPHVSVTSTFGYLAPRYKRSGDVAEIDIRRFNNNSLSDTVTKLVVPDDKANIGINQVINTSSNAYGVSSIADYEPIQGISVVEVDGEYIVGIPSFFGGQGAILIYPTEEA